MYSYLLAVLILLNNIMYTVTKNIPLSWMLIIHKKRLVIHFLYLFYTYHVKS